MTQPNPLADAQAWREAQRKEYGTYVAVHDIDIDGVRAYNAGDQVPASNVDKAKGEGTDWLADGAIAKVGTKAAAPFTGPTAATADDTKGGKG